MSRILVSESIAEAGLDRLRAAGHTVDVRQGLSPDELKSAIKGAHALIIRSATQVDADLLAAADELMVVGRAGVGLDNVDTEAATARGVMVVNAPTSNIISAAEQTMALLLAQARNIPQAHSALVQGRWERKRWNGVELADKTLGIVGLGRIGQLVAERAKGFDMRIVAFDPYITDDRARRLGVEMMELDQVVAESDFLTIHLPKTAETTGLINAEMLKKAKSKLRVINVARGGIVDEADLAASIRDGIIEGAAIDVFETEPTTESPLFELDSVVVTPHLGASTVEAQDKAGDAIADMVLLALNGDFVPWAVNVKAQAPHELVAQFLPLTESLGRLYSSLVGSSPERLELCAAGDIATHDTRMLGLAALKGFFSRVSSEPVSYVNAPDLAKQSGVTLHEVQRPDSPDYVNLVTLSDGTHSISGTLSGRRAEPRIVEIDGHGIDVPPASHMVVITNDDRPGVIGTVGVTMGEAAVNIADMDVGRVPDGDTTVMVLSVTAEPPSEALDRLRAAEGILSVEVLHG